MLNNEGLAIQDVKLPVYHFNVEREFTALLFLKIEKGTGLPGQSTLVPIHEMKGGFTQVFNEEKQQWEYVVDHRYKTAYDINTKQSFEIDYFGELKEEHTLLAPPSQDHDFVKGKWVITKEKKAELKEREEAQAEAQKQEQINDLKLRLQVHMMMGEEEEAKALVLEIRALQK